MNPVSSSTLPAPPATFTLAALDVAAPQAGSARAAAAAGSPGGDTVLQPAAAKAGSSKASKTTKSPSKTTAAKKKSTSKAGYTSSGTLPKDLAFLRDAKLSVEEKLMRFLAYMNAKSEAEITKKMEEMGGGAPAKATGTSGTGGTGATAKPKKKGFWGNLLDAAKGALPAVGLTFQVLKNPTTKAMLKQLGGPVLGAAAAAFGFPQAAPVLAKLGPQIVDYAAAGLQAIEKAAAAEGKSSTAGASSGSGSAATASASGTGKSEQLQLLELNRLVEKQGEMFKLASNMLRSWHDTRSHIIGNLR